MQENFRHPVICYVLHKQTAVLLIEIRPAGRSFVNTIFDCKRVTYLFSCLKRKKLRWFLIKKNVNWRMFFEIETLTLLAMFFAKQFDIITFLSSRLVKYSISSHRQIVTFLNKIMSNLYNIIGASQELTVQIGELLTLYCYIICELIYVRYSYFLAIWSFI